MGKIDIKNIAKRMGVGTVDKVKAKSGYFGAYKLLRR